MKLLPFLLLAVSLLAKDEYFFEKPYLQLGNRPATADSGALDVMWIGHDKDVDFLVEYKTGNAWIKAPHTMLRRVDFPLTAPHRVYSATLEKLKPGASFTYRISVAGKTLVEAASIARKDEKSDTHFVVWGDSSVNSLDQRAVAYQASLQKPDFIFITGDIVYNRGRVSEYQEKFWPIYNADQAGLTTGAPLMRNTLFAAVVGNHDSQGAINLVENPDPLAYYLYWSLPTNGPAMKPAHKFVPQFTGNDALQKKFLEATSATFPNMANFSFDYGNVHWTVLDSNSYVDWTDPEFRKWVAEDLKAASKAKWRIVAFHHPPYNSSKAHFKEQRLRVLSDVFEQGKADLVLCGHVHNYQRTFPLTFEVEPGFVLGKNQEVPGKWTLDTTFDGEKNTKPKGVIYIVTGAGGAGLYNIEQTTDKSTWLPFTTRFFSNIHSFSVIDTTSKQLTLKQISAEGKELDRFTIKR